MDHKYSRIQLYNAIHQKYKEYLKDEIVSISLVQNQEVLYLETIEKTTTDDGLIKETVDQIDLGIMEEKDENGIIKPYFSLNNKIEDNAAKFINELDTYSIINITNLFREKACEEIQRSYN